MTKNALRNALVAAGILTTAVAANAQVTYDFNLNTSGNELIVSDTGNQVTDFKVTVPAYATITDVNIRLTLRHDFGVDLRASLIAPNGTTVDLFNATSWGPTGADDYFNVVTLSDGSTRLTSTENYPIATGTYGLQGTANLSSFNSAMTAGDWTLRITDIEAGNTGRVYGVGDTPTFRGVLGANEGTALVITGTAVPEPSTYAIVFGMAALGGAMVRRYRKQG